MPPMGALEELVGWGALANCYAYAFNRQNPLACAGPCAHGEAYPGHTAWPGWRLGAAAAGRPAPPGATPAQRLIAGVLIDSRPAAGGMPQVTQVAGAPGHVPQVHAGCYLVALLCHANGFHFLRRDSFTGRWSWKDGNGGSVKLNALDTNHNRFLYITDNNLNDLIVGRPATFVPWAYAGMRFAAFFRVPNGHVQRILR